MGLRGGTVIGPRDKIAVGAGVVAVGSRADAPLDRAGGIAPVSSHPAPGEAGSVPDIEARLGGGRTV